MFKKFKDRLSEVSEEVKKDPRFQNSLASVNSLAEKTVAVIKNDQALRGSRESLNSQTASFAQSQSDLSPYHGIALGGDANNFGYPENFDQEYNNVSKGSATETHKRSKSSDIQLLFGGANNFQISSSKDSQLLQFKDKSDIGNNFDQLTLSASASSPALAELNFSHSAGANEIFSGTTNNIMNSNNNFFSLTEDDEDINISDDVNTCSTPTKQVGDTTRQRRSSSTGSKGGETSDLLFPIYEDPEGPKFTLPTQQDLDSTTGSEWGSEAGSQTQLNSISKEQLFQMLQKTRSRYHKYKGRYADVANAYGELENENTKVKNVMQQTQDKALRRISELKEQCQLEQKAKRHLEEELRSDLEEKEHIIKALQTKVVLLKSGGNNVIEDAAANNGNSLIGSDDGNGSQTLINLGEGQESCSSNSSAVIKRDSEKVAVLEDKVRRLEALLTKCKESIKANKQKTTALTDVKDSLAQQLADKEVENEKLTASLKSVQNELDSLKKREQVEELQIAETKMQMHQEIITKDEEIGKLRTSLKHIMEDKNSCDEQIVTFKDEIDQLKQSQDVLEKSLENEKATALQEMSRGKAGALQALKSDMEKQISQLKSGHAHEKEQLIEKMKLETESKLKELGKDKQREVMLKEEEMQKLLTEKDDECRLAIEEMELRLTALSTGDDAKSKLLGDLESRIQSVNNEKKALQTKLTEISKKVKQRELEFKQEEKSHAIIIEQKVSDLTKEIKAKETMLKDSEKQLELLVLEHEKLTKTMGKIESSKNQLEAQMNENKNKTDQIKEEHQNTIDELNLLKSNAENQSVKIATLEQQVEEFKQQVYHKNTELRDAKNEHDSKLNMLQEKLENISKDSTDESQKHIESQLAIIKEQHLVEVKKMEDKNLELKQKFEEALANLLLKEQTLTQERETLQELSRIKSNLETLLKDKETSLNDALENIEKNKLNEKPFLDQNQAKDEEIAKLKDTREKANKTIDDRKEEITSLTEQLGIVKGELAVLQERLKEVEVALSFANEDICKKSQLLEEKEATLVDNSEQIELFEKEMEALSDQLNQFQTNNSKSLTTIADMEKENLSLKNSNKSAIDLKQQMITYQKELQDQIRQAEDHEKALRKQVDDLQLSSCDKDNEIKDMAERNRNEISQLKSDLELKIRLEREKETSFKELQVQSIAYQKKLQEQLGEKEKQVDEINAKFKGTIKSHSKEVETASKKIDHLTAKINDISKKKDEQRREIESLNVMINKQSGSKDEEVMQLRNKTSELATCLKNKEDEISKQSLQIESILKSSEGLTDIKAKLELEKNGLSIQLKNVNDDTLNLKHEMECWQSDHAKVISKLEATNKTEICKLQELVKGYEESNGVALESARQNILELENRLSETENKLIEQSTSLNEEKEFAKAETFDLNSAKIEIQRELDSSKQALYELQLICKAKDSEIEDVKSRHKETIEMADNMRKDLTSSQEDKASQLLEFEETLEDLEKQVAEQKERNENLQEQISRQSREIETSEQVRNSSQNKERLEEDHDNNLKTIVKEYEKKLAENGDQHDEEILRLKEAAEHEVKIAVGDCRRQITELKEELYEKTSLYEDLIDRHAAELAAKQKEMDEEVEACSRLYQTKLNELQTNSERLATLAAAAAAGSIDDQQQELMQGTSWNSERLDIKENIEDFQRTPTHKLSPRSPPPPPENAPARLSISESNHVNSAFRGAQNSRQYSCPSYSLEEATEYEYLRNILYQYMLGREPLTLAKVLATVVKFSPEQMENIVFHEEKKASVLGNLGRIS